MYSLPIEYIVHTREKKTTCFGLLTAAFLAQLGKRRSAEREVTRSNPGRTNIQGL